MLFGFITSNSINYNTLEQPPLAPPAILFPIVWTILYTLMGVSYGILDVNGLVDSSINTIYYLQLFVNALWSIFFFVFKWRLISVFWIVLLDVLVILLIKRFFETKKVSSYLNILYLAWILFATYLTIGIYILN